MDQVNSNEATFTLTREELGLGELVSNKEIEDNFADLKLTSLPTSRRSSTTFASVERSAVNPARSGLNDSNADMRRSDATDPIEPHLGFVAENVDGTDRATLRPQLDSLYNALGSASTFLREQDTRDVFDSQTLASAEIGKLLGERR